MEVVAGFIVVGLVVAIAAFIVTREAGRIARNPPPALFDFEDAFEWVLAHLPDDVAATLTPDDVRRILDFQVEFFKRKGVSANGSTEYPPGTVVIGGAETVAFILERSAAGGESYLPEQVHGVLETQLAYLRAIGAVGPAGRRGGQSVARLEASVRVHVSSTRERRWSIRCMINVGPWRCAAARPGSATRTAWRNPTAVPPGKGGGPTHA